MRSVLSDGKKLSISALSQTLPDWLIEQGTPLPVISRWNCLLVYWADSTGRRNTCIILANKELVEDFGRRPSSESFARSRVHRMGYSAAPEPATWGMMILGFERTGGALRRPRRKNQPTLAAA